MANPEEKTLFDNLENDVIIPEDELKKQDRKTLNKLKEYQEQRVIAQRYWMAFFFAFFILFIFITFISFIFVHPTKQYHQQPATILIIKPESLK